MEGLNFYENEEQSLELASILKKLRRPSPIPGMGGEQFADPVAQEILNLGSENLAAVEAFLKEQKIVTLLPLDKAYGVSAVVLDAGDRVVRLSKGAVTEKPDAPYVLQPLAVEIIGRLSVQISKKLETQNITEDDVTEIQKRLRDQGYQWDDAGTDNLGRDENGNLFIIDGSVTKETTSP